MNTPSPSEALAGMEALCARSEQCSHDIRTRLRRYGFPEETIAEIIDTLKSGRYIDDARFAHAYVRDKYIFARWGRRKIQAGLIAKRIDRYVISDAIDGEIDLDTYITNLRDLLRSKSRTMKKPITFTDSQKLLRFAASRGFEPDLIIETLRERDILHGTDDDELD